MTLHPIRFSPNILISFLPPSLGCPQFTMKWFSTPPVCYLGPFMQMFRFYHLVFGPINSYQTCFFLVTILLFFNEWLWYKVRTPSKYSKGLKKSLSTTIISPSPTNQPSTMARSLSFFSIPLFFFLMSPMVGGGDVGVEEGGGEAVFWALLIENGC